MEPFSTRVNSLDMMDMPTYSWPQRSAEPEQARKPAPKPTRYIAPQRMAQLLAKPERFHVIEVCLDGRTRTTLDLARPVGMSPRRMSDHLRQLQEAGILLLVQGDNDGRENRYKLDPEFLRVAEDGSVILDYGGGTVRFPKVQVR